MCESYRDGFFDCKQLVYHTVKMFEKHATSFDLDEVIKTIEYVLEPVESCTEESVEGNVIDYLEENGRLKQL